MMEKLLKEFWIRQIYQWVNYYLFRLRIGRNRYKIIKPISEQSNWLNRIQKRNIIVFI